MQNFQKCSFKWIFPSAPLRVSWTVEACFKPHAFRTITWQTEWCESECDKCAIKFSFFPFIQISGVTGMLSALHRNSCFVVGLSGVSAWKEVVSSEVSCPILHEFLVITIVNSWWNLCITSAFNVILTKYSLSGLIISFTRRFYVI